MSQKSFSLPPLLNDEVQGRLYFIILRPILIPPLLSHQELELKFSWWGSSYLHTIRFLPDAEEVKITFDICCDLKGLQRYLNDATDLEVHINIACQSSDQNKSNNAKLVTPCKYTKYQLRNKKEWKYGDYIGRFVISDLHFNARGEYVNECNIFNPYGDHCGSVVVFMLHTDQTSTSKICALKETLNKEEKSQSKVTSLNEHNYLETTFPNEKLSPRFIPLKKEENVLRKKEKPRKLTFNQTSKMKSCSPQKSKLKQEENCLVRKPTVSQKTFKRPVASTQKQIDRSLDINESVFSTHGSQAGYKSRTVSSSYDSRSSFNDNFIITKLFSFVDSGAIRLSDLPELIQICQGRCPSIEFDSSELNLTYHESLKEKEHSSPTEETTSSRRKTTILNKGNKNVNFSGISYHSESSLLEVPKAGIVFDEKFMSLVSKERPNFRKEEIFKAIGEEGNCNNSSSNEVKVSDLEEGDSSDHEPDNQTSKQEETSLFILTFHSIHFTPQNLENDQKIVGVKNTHRKTVRQRSKVCYFVEVILNFEGLEKLSQCALYISRRVENEEVLFGESRIFRLLDSTDASLLKNKGYMKFRVSRRLLGNRLRDEVGIGIISLEKLGNSNGTVALPLWCPSGASDCSKNVIQGKGTKEMPLGFLNFVVAFAYTHLPRNIFRKKAGDFRNLDISDHLQIPAESFQEDFANLEDVSQELVRTREVVAYYEDEATKESSDHRQQVGAQNETFISEGISVVMQSSEDVSPSAVSPKMAQNLELDVHLEIVEATGLPLLRRKGGQLTFPPSCYVQTALRSSFYYTSVVKSSSPKWNYAVDFNISPKDLKETNSHLVLKLFHCLEDSSPTANDLMLGFATIDTQFLWNSFTSLCGWIPIFNLNGAICGEIEVSLTPKSRWCWRDLPVKDREAQPCCEENSGVVSHHIEEPSIPSTGHSKDTKSLSNENLNKSTQSNIKNENTLDKPSLKPEPPRLNEETKLHENLGTISLVTGTENSSLSDENEIPHINDNSLRKTVMKQQTYKGSGNLNKVSLAPPCKTSENISQERHGSNISTLRDNDATCSRLKNPDLNRKLTHVIEGMQWMNHFSSFDTPCVSYLDLGEVELTPVQGHRIPQDPSRSKSRRRIAANLNFL